MISTQAMLVAIVLCLSVSLSLAEGDGSSRKLLFGTDYGVRCDKTNNICTGITTTYSPSFCSVPDGCQGPDFPVPGYEGGWGYSYQFVKGLPDGYGYDNIIEEIAIFDALIGLDITVDISPSGDECIISLGGGDESQICNTCVPCQGTGSPCVGSGCGSVGQPPLSVRYDCTNLQFGDKVGIEFGISNPDEGCADLNPFLYPFATESNPTYDCSCPVAKDCNDYDEIVEYMTGIFGSERCTLSGGYFECYYQALDKSVAHIYLISCQCTDVKDNPQEFVASYASPGGMPSSIEFISLSEQCFTENSLLSSVEEVLFNADNNVPNESPSSLSDFPHSDFPNSEFPTGDAPAYTPVPYSEFPTGDAPAYTPTPRTDFPAYYLKDTLDQNLEQTPVEAPFQKSEKTIPTSPPSSATKAAPKVALSIGIGMLVLLAVNQLLF